MAEEAKMFHMLTRTYARLLLWVADQARHLAWSMPDVSQHHSRLVPLHERLDEALLALSEAADERFWASHRLACSVGRVCSPCADQAPGWWEFEFDCAGHECGDCDMCRAGQAPVTFQAPTRPHVIEVVYDDGGARFFGPFSTYGEAFDVLDNDPALGGVCEEEGVVDARLVRHSTDTQHVEPLPFF